MGGFAKLVREKLADDTAQLVAGVLVSAMSFATAALSGAMGDVAEFAARSPVAFAALVAAVFSAGFFASALVGKAVRNGIEADEEELMARTAFLDPEVKALMKAVHDGKDVVADTGGYEAFSRSNPEMARFFTARKLPGNETKLLPRKALRAIVEANPEEFSCVDPLVDEYRASEENAGFVRCGEALRWTWRD